MPKLEELRANRAKLQDQVEAKRAEHLKIVTEERALTADEETEFTNLRSRLTSLDALLVEEEAREAEALKQQEERDAKLGHQNDTGNGAPNVRVGWEDNLVYSQAHPENSWYRDLLAATSGGPRAQAASERMREHQEQMEGLLRAGGQGLPDEKSRRAFRAVRSYNREVNRQNTSETRATSTGTSSMGDFAPPIYMLPEYAAFRTYGRTLIDNLKKYPMPETGMVFSVPTINQPTQAVNQTNSSTQGNNENQTVSSRDMTATYNNGTVQTVIDNLNVSQQYLDRVGPGIDGDMIVHDDQQRQMNRALNIYAWNALFGSGIPVVPYTDSVFNAYKFKQACHQAKAAIRKTDGIVAYPTTFFGDADLWESIEGAYDASNRPFVVPQGVAFNPIAVGDNVDAPEGYTGFKFAGVPAFADEAMWVSWSGGAASSGGAGQHPAIIGAFDIASYWMEGAPVIRVLPQPGAATLTVLIQQYNYCAYVPVYVNAIQAIYGTGTATANLL